MAFLVVITLMTGFAQENKKAAAARREIKKGKEDLEKAKIDSVADYESFKKESELKIAGNKRKIEVLKTKEIKDCEQVKAKYESEVLALERRNNVLDAKIKSADVEKINLWSAFKRDVNRELIALGKAIRKMGVMKVK